MLFPNLDLVFKYTYLGEIAGFGLIKIVKNLQFCEQRDLKITSCFYSKGKMQWKQKTTSFIFLPQKGGSEQKRKKDFCALVFQKIKGWKPIQF
jgi:hypothetical protein